MNDAQKLEAVEASLRRWHTRLTRATNAIRKLERKRRRLLMQTPLKRGRPLKPFEAEVLVTRKVVETTPLPELDAYFQPEPVRPRGHVALAEMHKPEAFATAVKEAAEDAGIPPFLDRTNPAVEDAATTARKKAEADARKAEARKRMPLTGRAAMEAIRPKRKAKA